MFIINKNNQLKMEEENKTIEERLKILDKENSEKGQPQKISYEQLEVVAQQYFEEAQNWKQKAYQEAGKNNRISIILELLKIPGLLETDGYTLKSKIMGELVEILYPTQPQAKLPNPEEDLQSTSEKE